MAYHRVTGQAARTRLIGRERSYHGVGFGGTAVGGIGANRRSFGPLLAGVDHLPHTYQRENQAFSRGQPEWGAHLADELERIVGLHGAETISAVIVEPVAGSTGVLPPPKGYLQGHPLAAAAALATIQVYQDEALFQRAAGLASYWEDSVHSLKGLPHVVDARNLGLMAGIELEPRDEKPSERVFEAFIRCFEKGALVRAAGETIAVSPPLIMEKSQIDDLFSIIADVLKVLA